jgi:hypothetical protein
MEQARQIPGGVDPSKPAPARIYDYLLSGENNFPSDREAADRITAVVPEIRDCAWANRGFHQRAARWIARRGIRQFIDIGSGLPTVRNTHEVVQEVDLQCRVVYVDNDPMVRAISGQQLAGDTNAALVVADIREPDELLNHRDLRSLIDFSQPAGLLMTAVLHFVADGSDPWGLVKRYAGALAPGSYVALSHATADKLPPRSVQAMYATYEHASTRIYLRTEAEVRRFFEGLEFVPPYRDAEPSVSYVGVWGADDPAAADSEGSRVLYCGVARRP